MTFNPRWKSSQAWIFSVSTHHPWGQLAEMLQEEGYREEIPIGVGTLAIWECRPCPFQCPHFAHVPTERMPCKEGGISTPSPKDDSQGAGAPCSNPTLPLLALCPLPQLPSVSSSVSEAVGLGRWVLYGAFWRHGCT